MCNTQKRFDALKKSVELVYIQENRLTFTILDAMIFIHTYTHMQNCVFLCDAYCPSWNVITLCKFCIVGHGSRHYRSVCVCLCVFSDRSNSEHNHHSVPRSTVVLTRTYFPLVENERDKKKKIKTIFLRPYLRIHFYYIPLFRMSNVLV